MLNALKLIALLSLLSTGLIAGFFYAWVCSTMWGLDSAPPAVAIQAMNAMNQSVRNAVFFPTFFLTPVLLLVASVLAFVQRLRGVGLAFIFAAAIYFSGAFMPTVLVNVPMNRALETVQIPTDIEMAREIWIGYSDRWQFWNQFRAVASGIALLCAGWALLNIPTPAKRS